MYTENSEPKRVLTIKERISYGGAIYHVTQRAPGRELVFVRESDYAKFLLFLYRVARRHELELYAYAFLPNHVHLLIMTNKANISEAMKNVFETYAVYFNKRYSRKGHVFCGRFRACLCNDEAYFLAASVYINLNPVRSGLCESAEKYQWSTAKAYLGETPPKLIDVARVLNLLSKDPKEARRRYLKIMEDSLARTPQHMDQKRRSGYLSITELILSRRLLSGQPPERGRQGMGHSGVQHGRNDRATGYLVSQMLANGHRPEEIQENLGISRATYYRYLQRSSRKTHG